VSVPTREFALRVRERVREALEALSNLGRREIRSNIRYGISGHDIWPVA